MIRKFLTASSAIVVALAFQGPVRAQDGPVKDAPAAGDSDNKDAAPDDPSHSGPVPGWSIKPEVNKLGESMKQFNGLIGSLNRANKDLSDEFQKDLKDPKNEVVSSSLERKMAAYAAQVQGEFSSVISEQDALSSNFRMLRRKLQQLAGHLGSKAGDFQEKYKGFNDEARKQEKGLIDLAIKIKENPPEDPEDMKKLKHEFLMKQRRYNLKMRYVKGYAARLQNYQQLRKNLDRLADLFVTLQEKFGDLMENLSNEKQYLRDSIELQADALRIKQIIRDGIWGGDNAIKNVSDKLAGLYVKVDAFTQVHDRISSDMNKFVESQTDLLSISDSLEHVGDPAGFGVKAGETLDKSIDDFYNRSKNGTTADDDQIMKAKDGTNENK